MYPIDFSEFADDEILGKAIICDLRDKATASDNEDCFEALDEEMSHYDNQFGAAFRIKL